MVWFIWRKRLLTRLVVCVAPLSWLCCALSHSSSPHLSVLLSISFSILFWRFAVTTVAACSTHPFPAPLSGMLSSAWLLLTETVRTVCWIRESSQLKLTAKLKSENEFVISFTATFAHFTVSWYSCHWGFWVNAFTRISFFFWVPLIEINWKSRCQRLSLQSSAAKRSVWMMEIGCRR